MNGDGDINGPVDFATGHYQQIRGVYGWYCSLQQRNLLILRPELLANFADFCIPQATKILMW